jgi:hypothetical protein
MEDEVDDEQQWNGWEAESETDSSDSGDWVDVKSEGSYAHLSDSEDEKAAIPSTASPSENFTAPILGPVQGPTAPQNLATTKVRCVIRSHSENIYLMPLRRFSPPPTLPKLIISASRLSHNQVLLLAQTSGSSRL